MNIKKKMKRYITYIIMAAAAVVTTSSCTGLDVDVKSKYTSYPTESEVA